MTDGWYIIDYNSENVGKSRVWPLVEDKTPSAKLPKWRLIWAILFEKKVYGRLIETLQYALRFNRTTGGFGSLDVSQFRRTKLYTYWANKEKRRK